MLFILLKKRIPVCKQYKDEQYRYLTKHIVKINEIDISLHSKHLM